MTHLNLLFLSRLLMDLVERVKHQKMSDHIFQIGLETHLIAENFLDFRHMLNFVLTDYLFLFRMCYYCLLFRILLFGSIDDLFWNSARLIFKDFWGFLVNSRLLMNWNYVWWYLKLASFCKLILVILGHLQNTLFHIRYWRQMLNLHFLLTEIKLMIPCQFLLWV